MNKTMKIFKTTLRILISIVIGIPTIWILYFAFTCCGLFLIIPIVGVLGIPFNWLISDKEGLDDSIDMIKMGGYILIQPIIFWIIFIKGENPLSMLE